MPDQVIQQQIQVDLGTSPQTLGDLRTDFDQVAKSTSNAEKQAELLNSTLAKTSAGAEDVGEKFQFTNEQLLQMSGRYTSVAEAQTEQTVATVANTAATEEAQVASSGMLDSLAKQRVAFQDVGRIITGQGFNLRSLSSNFALLGPGIVIAAAAIGFLGEQLIKYVNSTDTAISATAKINAEITKNLSDQVGQIQVLTATIQDNNTSQTERKKAIADLVEQHPNYFKNLQDEDGVTKNLTTDTQKFTKALEEEARIKAISTQVSKLVADQLQAEADAQDKIAFLTAQTASDRKNNNQDAIALDNQEIALTKENTVTKVAEIQKQIDIYTKLGVAAEQSLSGLGGETGKPKKTDADSKEKRYQNDLEALHQFEDSAQEITSDAQTKELAILAKHYDTLMNKFKEFADLQTQLTEEYQEQVSEIYVKYEAIEVEREDKAYADHLKRQQQIKDSNTKQLGDLQKLEDDYYRQAQGTQQGREAGAEANENAKYQKIVQAANLTITNQKTLDTTLEALAKTHQANLAAIRNEGALADSKMISQQFTKDRQEVLKNQQMSSQDKEKAISQDQKMLNDAYDAGLVSDQDYTQQTEANAQARTQVRNAELSSYQSIANSLGTIQTALNNLGAQNTALAKAIGLAQIAISAGVAVAKAVAAASDLPFPANLAAIASSIAIVLTDIASAEKLLKSADIPGGSSSSGPSITGSIATTSYSAPTLPSATISTAIAPQSIAQITNAQQNQPPVRAYVLESDVTAAQQRVANYQAQSKIGN